MNDEAASARAKSGRLRAESEGLKREYSNRVAALRRESVERRDDSAKAERAPDEETRTREALLFMLEDLEESRRAIEQAHHEWIQSVDALRDPMLVHDEQYRVLRCNRAYAERAGMEFKDLIGRPYWECFPKRGGPLPGCEHKTTRTAVETRDKANLEEFTLDSGEIFVSRAFVSRDEARRFLYALHIFEDVTERKFAEQALLRLNRALKTLSKCNEALIHAGNEAQLLDEMCNLIIEVGGYQGVWVGFAEHDQAKTVRSAAHAERIPGYVKLTNVTWGDDEFGRGPAGTAIREGAPRLCRDATTDPAFAPWRTDAIRLGFRSVLALPLLADSRPFGVLVIRAAERDAFDEQDIPLLKELAGDLAFGIVTSRMRVAHEQSAQRLQRSMESTVQAIAATVDLRDPYTAGHQQRVAELAAAIAREMGLPDDQVHGLHLASTVHDLGKIRIPAEILSKPTRLTRVEYEIIKSHAQLGYEILKDVDFPWPIAEIVRQHHERLDGSGYPRGLKADDILIEAKILAIADTIEAMGAARPYRPAIGGDAALKEVSSRRGTLYDAAAVDACLRLFTERRFTFPELQAGARI